MNWHSGQAIVSQMAAFTKTMAAIDRLFPEAIF